MAVTNIPIYKNLDKSLLGKSPINFLKNIGKPFWIFIEGNDPSRSRVMTTLLHGNEPSGIAALHKWLLLNKKPAVNMYFFIGAVRSALMRPFFSNRYLPNGQDLNRCFKSDIEGEGGAIALNILSFIDKLKPEAVLDLHDTSSPGKSFAISIKDSPSHQALAALFTNKLVINHLRLGSIMESDHFGLPIVTIECGGYNDPLSVKTAYMGIERYTESEDLWHKLNTSYYRDKIEVYHKAYRLEYIKDGQISFGPKQDKISDLTILSTNSNENFQSFKKGQIFAYTKSKDLNIFKAFIDNPNDNYISEYFIYNKGEIIVKQDMTIFMLTNNPFISKNDCVCYFTVN
jgi:hypothetical protein